jgi:hypothetical protein
VTRWTRRLLFAAVAVLVPALAGCEAGADAPTQEFHPAAEGALATAGGVTINDAFVLGPALGGVLSPGGQAGVFLALTSVGSDQLLSVSAPGTASSVQLVGGPVTLTPNSLVALTGPAPKIVLTGLTTSLSGGQTIRLVFDFANEGQVPLLVPVEPDAYDYSSYSPPAIPPMPTATPTHRAKPTPSASVTPSPTS